MPLSSRSRRRLGWVTLKIQALRSFETTGTCPTSQCNTPEVSYLQQHRCENFKSRNYASSYNCMRFVVQQGGGHWRCVWYLRVCRGGCVSASSRRRRKALFCPGGENGSFHFSARRMVALGRVAWLLSLGVVVLVNRNFIYVRGLLEKYPTVFFYANTWWIII